jgi:hypothetical protein
MPMTVLICGSRIRQARCVRHCAAFASETVEAPSGRAVASNRLASITRFANMITTDTRNGASRRVPATGARVRLSLRAASLYYCSKRALDSIEDSLRARLPIILPGKPPMRSFRRCKSSTRLIS